MSDYLNPYIQETMSLREWMEDRGALREGARIAWGPVTWTVKNLIPAGHAAYLAIVHDDTQDEIDLGTCAALPAAGWRVLE